jgi:N-acetylglucosaminyldiphosphoundecaprenol N-acetyl-beta-D-mannosaminyltransferase
MTSDLPRRNLFGLNFVDTADLTPVIEAILDGSGVDPALEDPVPVLVTPNVDLLVHLDRRDSPVAADVIRRASYVLADGQPVVWASRWLGAPLQTRLAGSTLIAELWPRLIAEERRVLVIAASEELAAHVRLDNPGAYVVVPPRFDADDHAALSSIVASCAAACGDDVPAHVIVGLSYPKQYTLIDELVRSWPGPVAPRLYLAVGASLEFVYGLQKRAPAWVQRIGMEWLYRFAHDPKRLFRRYFVDDMVFFAMMWRARRAAPATAATPAAPVAPVATPTVEYS